MTEAVIPKSEASGFDTHAHITKCAITPDEYLLACRAAGVGMILDAGIHPDDFENRYDILHGFPEVRLAAALAPHETGKLTGNKILIQSQLAKVEQICRSGKICAIGEIGLDYNFSKDSSALQREIFAAQLNLARSFHLPVFLHVRDAWDDALDEVKKSGVTKGVLHCFTGSRKDAENFLDLGFYISFSGIVTFKNAQNLQVIASEIPFDRILTETDSPWLAPDPLRGKPNTSANLPYINAHIARLRKISPEECTKKLWSNAERVLMHCHAHVHAVSGESIPAHTGKAR